MKTLSMDDFDNLYRQYGPMVLRRCRFILKNEDKALDAMQDVFVRLIERKEKISNVCSSLLYTMATNVCLNKIRSDKLRNGPEFKMKMSVSGIRKRLEKLKEYATAKVS